MTKKKLPQKWDKETKSIKAIQIAFDVSNEIQQAVKLEALKRGVSPSDQIREILGLPVKYKRVRPRLTVSLSKEDFDLLAKEHGLKPDDLQSIRDKANELIVSHVADTENK